MFRNLRTRNCCNFYNTCSTQDVICLIRGYILSSALCYAITLAPIALMYLIQKTVKQTLIEFDQDCGNVPFELDRATSLITKNIAIVAVTTSQCYGLLVMYVAGKYVLHETLNKKEVAARVSLMTIPFSALPNFFISAALHGNCDASTCGHYDWLPMTSKSIAQSLSIAIAAFYFVAIAGAFTARYVSNKCYTAMDRANEYLHDRYPAGHNYQRIV